MVAIDSLALLELEQVKHYKHFRKLERKKGTTIRFSIM